LAAGLDRAGRIALLVLRIGLPIEGRFRARTMLLRDIGEDRLRLRPAGIANGSRAVGVQGIFLRVAGGVVIEGGPGRLRAKGRSPGIQGNKKRCEQQ